MNLILNKLLTKIFLLTTLLSATSFASPVMKVEKLVTYTINVAFDRNPREIKVSIDSTGKVEQTVTSYKNPQTTTEVAQLSETSMNNLKTLLADVDTKAKLVDLNPGPECMDAPWSDIKMLDQAGQEVEIFRHAGCHTFKLQSGAAHSVIQVVLGLVELTSRR